MAKERVSRNYFAARLRVFIISQRRFRSIARVCMCVCARTFAGSFLFFFFVFISFLTSSESPRARDLISIHVPPVRDRLWQRLMNVFIVVRPSLCYSEESLESTFRDSSRVLLHVVWPVAINKAYSWHIAARSRFNGRHVRDFVSLHRSS